MIEKPKRPKKVDIQDRQPPRTLQELINRYDLDNTKIYDYLDELVAKLNSKVAKEQIQYRSWHSIILTRSDSSWLNLILYGSNHLREGNYSIANDFKLVTYGTTNSDLTIPTSAIDTITRHDWGFEVAIKRSEIIGDSGNEYDGIAIPHDGNLILQST